MGCPDCSCDLPQCVNGCVYTWRERFAWWLSWTHLSWRLRAPFERPFGP